MDSDERTVTLWDGEPPHPGQKPIWDRRREVWRPGGIAFLACGPRWGKDRLSTWLNLWGLLCLLEQRRASGSRLIPLVLSWVVAPSSEDYEQVWREYVVHTAPFPRRLHRSRGSERIELFPSASADEIGKDSILIDFKSGWNPDRLVGAGPDSAHITEGAKLQNESRDNLSARLATPGRPGVQIINGTPTEAPARWYVDLFRKARTDPSIVFLNSPSWENPTLGDDQLRALLRIKETVSDRRWRANWGAELIPDGAGLFRGLAQSATAQPEAPRAGVRYYKFYDLAGPGSDSSVVSVWRNDGAGRARQVHLDRWNDASWNRAEKRIEYVAGQYPGELHWDDTARLAARDRIGAVVSPREFLNPVVFTSALKAEMVNHAIHMIETGKATLLHPDSSPDARAQFEELTEFQATRSDAGNIRYSAPDGAHDDCVTGVIGALWAMHDAGADAADAFIRVTAGTMY